MGLNDVQWYICSNPIYIKVHLDLIILMSFLYISQCPGCSLYCICSHNLEEQEEMRELVSTPPPQPLTIQKVSDLV